MSAVTKNQKNNLELPEVEAETSAAFKLAQKRAERFKKN